MTRNRWDGEDYQRRFDELQAAGHDVHGEARFVQTLRPSSALDAGCGSGRVAIELDRAGIEVVGVDIDPSMLAAARTRAPHLTWVQADLAALELGRSFDVVVMAGNVPLFCARDRRCALVTSCARHLDADGWLVSGFQIGEDYPLATYDDDCRKAGLLLDTRFASWDGVAWTADAGYAVSVHRPEGASGQSRF